MTASSSSLAASSVSFCALIDERTAPPENSTCEAVMS
jgi:hypothetical protein